MIFKSKIYQENDTLIVEDLYKDIENFIKNEKENKLKELQKTNPNLTIDDLKVDRGHPLQHILNSTSGGYVSPTSMKSFESCPASYLYSKLVTEKTGSATSVGRSYHTIMEKWYNSEDRSIKNIYKILEQEIKDSNQENSRKSLEDYVKGYLEAKDYTNGQDMDHDKLNCFNEVFIKPTINPLGVNLNVPVYLLIDRIDIRDNGIYIIDYKTGMGDPNPYLLGEAGYLPQMIFYKWGIEAEYGQEIKNAYLCLPGASEKYKYVEMNVNSLVEQSKVIEKVYNHLENIRSIRDKKVFPEKIMRYCNSCQLKYNCYKYIKEKKLDESAISTEIDVNVNVPDNLINIKEE